MEDLRVRRDVAQSLENGEGEIGSRQLVREALADQSRQLSLMIERIETGDDAARAVTEEEKR